MQETISVSLQKVSASFILHCTDKESALLRKPGSLLLTVTKSKVKLPRF